MIFLELTYFIQIKLITYKFTQKKCVCKKNLQTSEISKNCILITHIFKFIFCHIHSVLLSGKINTCFILHTTQVNYTGAVLCNTCYSNSVSAGCQRTSSQSSCRARSADKMLSCTSTQFHQHYSQPWLVSVGWLFRESPGQLPCRTVNFLLRNEVQCRHHLASTKKKK